MIPRLHVITDDQILGRDGFISRAVGIMETGGSGLVFHLRGPGAGGRTLYSLASSLRDTASTSGGALLVNDRVDVALALGLSGVHLGQRSLPPGVARRILGPRCLLGLSVHSAGETEDGLGQSAGGGSGADVDFLLVGTVFSSPSHPERVPAGVGRIREIQEICSLPLLAIGGISPERVGEVMTSGAHGVAVRGGIWDAPDPLVATRVYLEELEKGQES